MIGDLRDACAMWDFEIKAETDRLILEGISLYVAAEMARTIVMSRRANQARSVYASNWRTGDDQ